MTTQKIVGPGGDCYCCSTCTEAPVCNIEIAGIDEPGNTITISWFVVNATTVSVTNSVGDVISTSRFGSVEIPLVFETCERIQVISTNDCGTTLCQRTVGRCGNCVCSTTGSKQDLPFEYRVVLSGVPEVHNCFNEGITSCIVGGVVVNPPSIHTSNFAGFNAVNGTYIFPIYNGPTEIKNASCAVQSTSSICQALTTSVWENGPEGDCAPAYIAFLGEGILDTTQESTPCPSFNNSYTYKFYLQLFRTAGASTNPDPKTWPNPAGNRTFTYDGKLVIGSGLSITAVRNTLGFDGRIFSFDIPLTPIASINLGCPGSDLRNYCTTSCCDLDFSPYAQIGTPSNVCGICGDVYPTLVSGGGDTSSSYVRHYLRGIFQWQ